MESKNQHRTKMIAPIIITILVIIYFFFYFGALISIIENRFIRVLVGIIPAILGCTMGFLCIQRIKEIKGGEEDDLSQY